MKRLSKMSGFSLMEMMIVMLIVAIIAAASAPMINKKMVQTAGNNSSPWVWTDGNSIAYNLKNSDTMTASIGMVKSPKKAKMYIDGGNVPQIAFGRSGNNIMDLSVRNKSLFFTNNVMPGTNPLIGVYGTGENMVVIGYNTFAQRNGSVVIGAEAKASPGENSVAIGYSSNAPGYNAVSIGYSSWANGYESIALGNTAKAEKVYAIAIGDKTLAATNSTAVGANADASGNYATAIGSNSTGNFTYATAVGYNTTASRWHATAIGYNTTADRDNATALGSNATAAMSATAIGTDTKARADSATALGCNATASGLSSIAIGNHTTASGGPSTAIGNGATASNNGIAIGNARAITLGTVAIGSDAEASHYDSVAIGSKAKTTASNQIVLGTANDTVYIPGNLVVGNVSYFGTNLSGKAAIWTKVWDKCGYVSSGESGNNYYLHFTTYAGGDDTPSYSNTLPSEISKFISSDRRLKNVGKAFTAGLNEIRKLEVFNYTFKKDPEKTPRVGVMAQDLQKIFPNAVFKGDDGFLRIRMEDMFYALVNAVKENDKRITDLEKQNKELLKRIEQLEKQLNK